MIGIAIIGTIIIALGAMIAIKKLGDYQKQKENDNEIY